MATNYAKARYTEVVDMQTVDGKLSIIGIHTPVGKSPYQKLKGFFTQFRKYRYRGISSLTICPASGLPIDPLGLSVQASSTSQMDPRDSFNPIMFKGCHGEHLHHILDSLMNSSEYVAGGVQATVGSPSGGGYPVSNGDADEVSYSLRKKELEMDALSATETAYYQWLTDTSWRKFGIQSVIKLKNLHPLVWKVARNMPLLPSASGTIYQTNTGEYRRTSSGVGSSPATADPVLGDTAVGVEALGNVPNVGVSWHVGSTDSPNGYVQEFTSGCSRLGWLPTTTHVQGSPIPQITALPKLFMGVLCLPPCYSVEQFMRAVIVHDFEFKDFNTSVGVMDNYVSVPEYKSQVANNGEESGYFNWIDYATSKGATLDIFNGDTTLISDGVA